MITLSNQPKVFKTLIYIVLPLFVISILYFTNKSLNKDEMVQIAPVTQNDSMVTKTGKITYVDPRTYPGENISYYLADNAGKSIILLSAKDDKLHVVEGLSVTVKGTIIKTQDGKADILSVEEITINGNN